MPTSSPCCSPSSWCCMPPPRSTSRKAMRLSNAIDSGFQELGVFQNGLPDARSRQRCRRRQKACRGTTSPSHALGTGHRSAAGASTPSATNWNAPWLLRSSSNDVALHMDADGLVVSLREMGFFDSGSASIKPGAQGCLRPRRPDPARARLLGPDRRPYRQRADSHLAVRFQLGTVDRARHRAGESFDRAYDISADRLSAAGYAEFHPVASNDDVKGRQLNRRVDVVILRTGRSPSPAPSAPAAAGSESATGP